jgi:hypothetical protein
VSTASGPVVAPAAGDASVHLPVKPMVALIGLMAVAVLGGWLMAGKYVAAAYYTRWIEAFRTQQGSVKGELSGRLWTLWR